MRCHLRGMAGTQWPTPRRGPGHPHNQPPAAPRPGAPRPLLCGARLRSHPWPTCPPHRALGRRRCHRAVQPGVGVSLPSPGPPPRADHHHWARRSTPGHRPSRAHTAFRVAGPPANCAATRRPALPRALRRTRRLVVVHALRTTTDRRLARRAQASTGPGKPQKLWHMRSRTIMSVVSGSNQRSTTAQWIGCMR